MPHRVNESRHEMRPVKAAIHTPAAPDNRSSSEIGPWCPWSRGLHEFALSTWQIGSEGNAFTLIRHLGAG